MGCPLVLICSCAPGLKEPPALQMFSSSYKWKISDFLLPLLFPLFPFKAGIFFQTCLVSEWKNLPLPEGHQSIAHKRRTQHRGVDTVCIRLLTATLFQPVSVCVLWLRSTLGNADQRHVTFPYAKKQNPDQNIKRKLSLNFFQQGYKNIFR